MKETNIDVLIVGAGPAGLMACNALVRAGVNVRIIDKLPTRVRIGQADGISPRSLEILQSYGFQERVFRDGNQMHMAAFYNPSPTGNGVELTERVPDVTAPTARYPFEMTTHQGNIEAILAESVGKHGVQIERPVIPTSLKLTDNVEDVKNPQAYAVEVVLQHLEPSSQDEALETVHAKFVIGGDGAHSWVREAIGITMDGEHTESVWGVVDILPDTNFPDIRTKAIIHSNSGTCLNIPRENDKARIYVQLDGKNALPTLANGRVDKSATSPEKLFSVAQEIFQPFSIDKIGSFDWWTIYQIGQRVASTYSQQDRVFIVGDACHTHSPKAGQGMNAGMADSHNLGWKLAYVLQGRAGRQLLKTYEAERRKFAQDLIDFDKSWAKLFTGKARTADNQDGVSHEHFRSLFQKFGGFTSGVGIQYEPSMITDTQYQDVANNLPIGQRVAPQQFIVAADGKSIEIQDLLIADNRFHLLVFTGDTCTDYRLQLLTAWCQSLTNLLTSYSPVQAGETRPIVAMFNVLAIAGAALKKRKNSFLDLPPILRPHWSNVLIDDLDTKGRIGGDGYDNYGVNGHAGGIAVVRPDGMVGTVVPLSDDGISYLQTFFDRFLLS